MKNPLMYAIAYKYESETFHNFVAKEDDMDFPSFQHLLPSKQMAEGYIEDQLSNQYEIVEVELISYRDGITAVSYEEPVRWQNDFEDDESDAQ